MASESMRNPGSWAFELVTPDQAARYLEANVNNRDLKRHKIAEFTDSMEQGRWEVTHQGIAFNCDGSLKDGQNRLHAIVKSGASVWMWVYRGLSERAMWAVDTGAARSLRDASQLECRETNRDIVAIAQRMLLSVTTSRFIPRRDQLDFVATHMEAIQFSATRVGGKHCLGRSACVRAPIARAWYTCDRERLMEFIHAMETGVIRDQQADAGAFLLIRWMQQSNSKGRGSNSFRAEWYAKTEAALRAFLDRRSLGGLRAVEREQFPLPNEVQES